MTTTDTNPGDGPEYRTVFVRAGRNGWGDGLELTPTPEKNKVISVTGGGVHAVAQRIAELSGAEAVDGFRTHVPDDQVLAAGQLGEQAGGDRVEVVDEIAFRRLRAVEERLVEVGQRHAVALLVTRSAHPADSALPVRRGAATSRSLERAVRWLRSRHATGTHLDR